MYRHYRVLKILQTFKIVFKLQGVNQILSNFLLIFHLPKSFEESNIIWKTWIDPLGRPTVPASSDHYFRTCFRPSVCSQFSKYRKTKQKSLANNYHYWWGCRSGRGAHCWNMAHATFNLVAFFWKFSTTLASHLNGCLINLKYFFFC